MATKGGIVAVMVAARGTWEARAMARLVAGDETALGELYDEYGAFS